MCSPRRRGKVPGEADMMAWKSMAEASGLAAKDWREPRKCSISLRFLSCTLILRGARGRMALRTLRACLGPLQNHHGALAPPVGQEMPRASLDRCHSRGGCKSPLPAT